MCRSILWAALRYHWCQQLQGSYRKDGEDWVSKNTLLKGQFHLKFNSAHRAAWPFHSNCILSFTLEWLFIGGVRIRAHSSQWATIAVYIGRCNARIWKARKLQSISGSAMICAMSSSSETTSSIYLKRAALHGNKWAGVWRWHASFLCLDTKTNFKWWNWQRTCSCLISDYTPLQTGCSTEWSWHYSF